MGAVEVVLDERHCGQLLFVRRVRLRLEQLRILAGNRPDIRSRPQDLTNDALELGGPVWVCIILSPHVGGQRFDDIA